MPWLRHLALFVAFVIALLRPAAAVAFVSAPDAGSQTRVGAFELVVIKLVGPASGATCGMHEGIAPAYDENASSYGFATGGAVDASTIRFSQNSIGRTFSSGGTVRETIAGLRTGAISPEAFPPIRVFVRTGLTFTLDNRRLFVFQEAGVRIRTVLATAKEIQAEAWKFTTRNDCLSSRVRGGL
jgi:hypothetical protein